MGTHGRTGLPRVLLGSVAEDVIRHAQVPVLVVPMFKRAAAAQLAAAGANRAKEGAPHA